MPYDTPMSTSVMKSNTPPSMTPLTVTSFPSPKFLLLQRTVRCIAGGRWLSNISGQDSNDLQVLTTDGWPCIPTPGDEVSRSETHPET